MPRLEFAGAAPETELNGAISNSATSFVVADGAGYPSGTTDPFVIMLGEAEKVLCSARTGNTFTISQRGYDGTTAVAHANGAKVEHVLDAGTVDELQDHVYDDVRDDHSQYVSNTRTTAQTIVSDLTLSDKLLVRPELKDYAETRTAPASAAGALTLDLETGNVFEVTLTENTTLTFSNPPATGKGGAFTLILKQDATGSRSVTWPSSVEWAAGTAPTITSTANGVDVFTFITTDAGTTWYGFVGGQAFA